MQSEFPDIWKIGRYCCFKILGTGASKPEWNLNVKLTGAVIITPKPSPNQQTHVLPFHRQRKLNNDLTKSSPKPVSEAKEVVSIWIIQIGCQHGSHPLHNCSSFLLTLLAKPPSRSHRSAEITLCWHVPVMAVILQSGTLTRADSHVKLCPPSSKMGLIIGSGTERDGHSGHRTSSLYRAL